MYYAKSDPSWSPSVDVFLPMIIIEIVINMITMITRELQFVKGINKEKSKLEKCNLLNNICKIRMSKTELKMVHLFRNNKLKKSLLQEMKFIVHVTCLQPRRSMFSSLFDFLTNSETALSDT